MINVIGSVNDLGYGNTTYNLVTELDKITNVSLFPMYDKIEKTNPNIDRALKNALFPVCNDTPCVRIWHQHNMAQWVSSPRIGFPIFELNKFTDMEKHHLSIPDRLFVCSKWAKDVIRSNGLFGQCDVVPLGYDPKVFYYQDVKKPNTTVFLNCGKWEVRKGHDILCELFNSAFSQKDDVELWMVNHNPFMTKEEHEDIIRPYKESPLGNKIKIFPRFNNHAQLASLMRHADFGIFPTRAEGWNLEGLEMIACGKKIITTNYSGHTEYATRDNACLVDIKELELAYDGKWFYKQGEWAKIGDDEKEQFVQHMRNCHRTDLRNNWSATVEQFTWENAARKIYEFTK